MTRTTPSPVRLADNRFPRRRWLAMLAAVVLQAATGGCATWQPSERADAAAPPAAVTTETAGHVRLSGAVLNASESRRLFGADVNGAGIQPVWLEVENSSPDTLWLLRAGTDPDYFSPLEVAWSFHRPMGGAGNRAIDDHFNALAFQNPIPPGSKRAGIIFTNPHRRTRVLNVDLLGQRRMIPFTLFLPVPDDPPDTGAMRLMERYNQMHRENLDDPDAFRAALEQLPCCAEHAPATGSGEPFNVVLVGEFDDLAAALIRRGYRSDRMELDDAQRLFGRRPDLVMRKAGQGGVPANWLRAWTVPLRYRDQPVLLVQAGRPVGGRFAVAEGQDLHLHPDVDEARNLLIQDMLYSGGLAKLGFVGGAGAADVARGPDGLEGTSYHADGLRAVMFVVPRPLALSDVELLEWVPYLERREAGGDAPAAR